MGACLMVAIGRKFLEVNLKDFRRMDPHLLVGLVNTELRNHAEDLADLVKTHGLDEDALVARLGEAGYEYQLEQKQFR
ncbi:hypothetical protein HNR46_003324 [Haloferula luteola]|uniref:DUF4250 domain-containing protein n=1 Tax=Haloferula luteola TaxID=595692 RepID=A0A840VK72_9BACT|nr:DUF4250 domain-containing protein [Haloferula luteola]MBB5353071.1 hypothetical protein [Haloferula luteola]